MPTRSLSAVMLAALLLAISLPALADRDRHHDHHRTTAHHHERHHHKHDRHHHKKRHHKKRHHHDRRLVERYHDGRHMTHGRDIPLVTVGDYPLVRIRVD